MYHFSSYSENFSNFEGGKFGVEIFCIISGAFFYLKYLRQQKTITLWSYLKKRYFRFLPYTTVSFFLMFFLLPRSHRSFGDMADLFSEYIWELLLVSMSGINAGRSLLNSPTWTISCLIIVECAVLGLLIYNKKLFQNVILPLSLPIIYGIWRNSGVDNRTWFVFTNFGVLRVWCAVIWGILAVEFSFVLQKIKGKSKMLTILEVTLYLLIALIMLYRSSFYYGLLVTVFSFLAVAITLSQRSFTIFLTRNSVLPGFLGELSLAVFLNHSLLLKLFQNHFGSENLHNYFVLFLITLLIFSWLYTYFMKKLIFAIGSIGTKLNHHYFQE